VSIAVATAMLFSDGEDGMPKSKHSNSTHSNGVFLLTFSDSFGRSDSGLFLLNLMSQCDGLLIHDKPDWIRKGGPDAQRATNQNLEVSIEISCG